MPCNHKLEIAPMIITLADKRTIVDSPQAMYDILKATLLAEDEIDQDKEHFWVIHLDARNRIKALELVSLGTINASIVHPREVFTRAVALRSSSLILAHNHPSGDLQPSTQDIEITEKLVQAGEILRIDIVDNLVITKDGFYSFKQEGLL